MVILKLIKIINLTLIIYKYCEKKEIVFLVSFKYLASYLNLQNNLIVRFSRNFDLIHFVNIDKLKIYSNRFENYQVNHIDSKNEIFKKILKFLTLTILKS